MLIISRILNCLKNEYKGSSIEITAFGRNFGSVEKKRRVGYYPFSIVDRDRKFLVVIELVMSLCRDRNSCVATWFSGRTRNYSAWRAHDSVAPTQQELALGNEVLS